MSKNKKDKSESEYTESVGPVVKGPYYKKHGNYPGLTKEDVKKYKESRHGKFIDDRTNR